MFVAQVSLKLTEFNASGGCEIDLSRSLVGHPDVGLFEGLVWIRCVDPVMPGGPANPDDKLRAVIVIQEKITRENFRTDQRIVLRRGIIDSAGNKGLPGYVIRRVHMRRENVKTS